MLTAATPLRKYLNILRISLVERLTYRADFFVATLFRFLPLVTSFLLWEAIFDSKPPGSEISGFSRNETMAYLLLVQISRMFSSMPGLAGGIARDIRDGQLKKYLLQPIDMIAYLLASRVAHKLAYIATSLLPYALLFFWFREVLPAALSAEIWLAYGLSLIMAFLLGFFFEACVGMAGFWLLEVTSFLYIIGTLNFFLSGHMFPLDFLPSAAAAILKALPFQYLAYYPAMISLGKIKGTELVQGLMIQAAWVLGLMLLSRFLYVRGLRHYSAYGG